MSSVTEAGIGALAEGEARTAAVARYLDAIRDLAPQIEATADAADETGVFDAELFDALKQRGLLEMLRQGEFGGDDLTPLEAMVVIAEASRLDMTTGWTLMVQNANLKYLELLDHDVAREFYRNGAPGIAGSLAPSATAVEVDGGFRITGRWGYASSYPHAGYVVGAARVVDGQGDAVLGDDGAPTTVMFLSPRSTSADESNWDVLGLRASGSVDHSLTDVFVPVEHTIHNGYIGTAPIWGGPTRFLGFTGWLIWCHTGVDLGGGRRILDEMRAHASHASYRKGTAAKSEVFRHNYAKAESAYRAARAWVLEIWGEIDRGLHADRPPTTQQLTDARAALLHLNAVNQENGRFVMVEIGGAAIRPSAIQRFYRDQMTASTHVQVNRKFFQGIAEVYLSDDPEQFAWTPHDLVLR